MSAADIIALVAGLTALITAVGTVMAQISHLNWHKAVSAPPAPYVPPATPIPPQQ